MRRGCVAAGHAASAEAGAEILRAGGNAVDAAVAAMATAFTAEPVLTGAGGGGFMLLRTATGKTRLFDGFARMPILAIEQVKSPDFYGVDIDFGDTVQTFHIGQAAVATPLLIKMLFAAHAEHGRMPMRDILSPAIAAAREGIALSALQASFLQLLTPILTATPACAGLHAPCGRPMAAGETFRNKDLAALLELLALEGVDEMYHGDVARAIGQACTPGGLLRLRDLQSAEVIVREPLATPFLDGRFITNPPPSSGGCLIAYSLNILEKLRRQIPHAAMPVLIAECLHASSLARGTDFDARVHEAGMEQGFLSRRRLAEGLAVACSRLEDRAVQATAEVENRHGSTTHVSVIDRDGLAVALTSSNGEGSGIVAAGTGIHLNNMLGEEDINPRGFHRLAAGTTLSSMMAPSIFEVRDRPALVLGSGGSNRLRGAIVQVLARHLLAGQDIEQAVQAPRVHNEGEVLDAEPGALAPQEEDRLAAMGWKIRHWRATSVYFGGVHAVGMDARGGLAAAGDHRRGGAVAWA